MGISVLPSLPFPEATRHSVHSHYRFHALGSRKSAIFSSNFCPLVILLMLSSFSCIFTVVVTQAIYISALVLLSMTEIV